MDTLQNHPTDVEGRRGGRPELRRSGSRRQEPAPGNPTRAGLRPQDEWSAAAVAHGSAVLTSVLGLAGGIGALVGPVIPLAMFYAYRHRSRFVAYHAMQSFVFQLTFALIYILQVALSAVMLTTAWTVSGLLAALLVGFLLMPVAALLTLLTVLALLATPVAGLGYALYAAYHVYQGANFRYWLIGDWVEKESGL